MRQRMAQKDRSQTEPREAPEGQKPTCAKRGLLAPSGTAPTVAHMPGEYINKTMPQTAKGATTNPWLAHVKKCAEMYQKEKEEQEKAQKKRRITKKAPQETMKAAEAKVQKQWKSKWSTPP